MACRAFFCDHRPDCEDLMCPGRPVTLHRVPFLHTRNGGETVDTDEPIPTPEEAEGWTLPVMWSLAVFAVACLIAAVCYGVQLQFPFE